MRTNHLPGNSLIGSDCSEHERKIFLASLASRRQAKSVGLAKGLAAQGIWMTDVSAMDRRSVKAQLAGRGDFRTTWWNLNNSLHGIFQPGATLEQRMYCFHARHQACTLFFYQAVRDYWLILHAIKHSGLMAGMRCAVSQASRSAKEPQ